MEDKIEQRKENRKKLKKRYRRRQIQCLVLATFYIVGTFFMDSWEWLLILTALVFLAMAWSLEWMIASVERLNDLRFDWVFENSNHIWRVFWQGWTKPPFK